jgi:hypothetical protein
LLGLFFDPEDGSDVPPKRRLAFNGLHGIISQNTVLFITTAVRASNPAIRIWATEVLILLWETNEEIF